LINDTTLRDGEQAPGVAFSLKEKISIARMLDEIGIREIEAGTPAMGEDERLAIKAIVNLGLNARIIAWCRALNCDIDAAMACGVEAVSISIPASDILLKHKIHESKEWALNQITSVIAYARKQGISTIYVGAEDASRANMLFLEQIGKLAGEEGAARLRFADTLGILDPFRTYKKIKHLVENLRGLEVEIHAHNDLGMATANTLAAIKAGAKSFSVTVGGLGERAGNAPLEEVVMALKYQEGAEVQVDTTRFKELAEKVSQAAGRCISPSKPIIGSMVFTHESGIHVDGILKHPATYEFIDPECVGQTRRFLIGKHSGASSLIYKMEQLGILLSATEARLLLPAIRSKSAGLKREITESELLDIYREYQQ
jgi:homocitrate synthase NifV